MEENYYALLISIFKNVNSKDSLLYVKYGKQTNSFKKNIQSDRKPYKDINLHIKSKSNYLKNPLVIKRKAEKEKRIKEEYEKIIELKKTYTGREIAKMLGISPSSVSAKINRYEKKKAIVNGPSKVPLTVSLNKNLITL